LLDEVAIFNIPLEADDILDIMNNGLEVVTGLRAPVEPRGKLAAIWGSLKSEFQSADNLIPAIYNKP